MKYCHILGIQKRLLSLRFLTCIIFVVGLLSGLFVYPRGVNAAAAASLSPASGTFGSTFQVSIVATGDSIIGVDVDVAYTGPVSFTSGSAGDIGCTPTIAENTSGTVSVTCFLPPGSPFSGTGTVATLNFSTSSAGTSTMTMTDKGDNLDSVAGGTYTVGPDPASPDPEVTRDLTTLPNTASSVWYWQIGIGLVMTLVGVVLFIRSRKDILMGDK